MIEGIILSIMFVITAIIFYCLGEYNSCDSLVVGDTEIEAWKSCLKEDSIYIKVKNTKNKNETDGMWVRNYKFCESVWDEVK